MLQIEKDVVVLEWHQVSIRIRLYHKNVVVMKVRFRDKVVLDILCDVSWLRLRYIL